MMLDSTSSKILTNKQVQLPPQNDTEESKTKVNSKPTASEAEVRLVVKFIVEEHIVYEGKIERVHQLESEELSRVVSRVAWEGAKEVDKAIIASESDKAEKEASDESKKPNQQSLASSDNPPDGSTDSKKEDTPNSPPGKSEEVLEECPSTAGTLDDHKAYVKSIVDTPRLESPKVEDDPVAQTEKLHVVEPTSKTHKTASKEGRNPIPRTGANKTSENASNLLQEASFGANSPDAVSLLVNKQQVRHNKIFAKWTDNHFYPGTILKAARDRKFVIAFYDGAQKNVAETDLIPLSSIEGKQVRVSIAKNYCVNAIVHNQQPPVNEQPMFNVEYQQDGLVQKCVPLKDIFLTGEQGMSLISQADRNCGASNFADVDLDNIIYEKRSRRLQEMEDFELTESPSSNGKRKRAQYNMRNSNPRVKTGSVDGLNNPVGQAQKRHSQSDINQDPESAESPDVLKTNFLCPNSNPPSEDSSSTGSSNVPNNLDLGQEFYFSNSPHRTKTSLLL